MVRACEAMKELYQIDAALPTGITVNAVGGAAACVLGATTGGIALAVFGAYSALGGGLLYASALHDTKNLDGFRNIKKDVTCCEKVTRTVGFLALPLLAPISFAVQMARPARPPAQAQH